MALTTGDINLQNKRNSVVRGDGGGGQSGGGPGGGGKSGSSSGSSGSSGGSGAAASAPAGPAGGPQAPIGNAAIASGVSATPAGGVAPAHLVPAGQIVSGAMAVPDNHKVDAAHKVTNMGGQR